MGLLPETHPAQPYLLPPQEGATTGALAERLQKNKKLNRTYLDIVADFGADPTGGTDISGPLQDAIDTAQSMIDDGSGVPAVWIGAGTFSLQEEIEWKSAPILGSWLPRVGTRILWDGANGATVFTKTDAAEAPGGMSFALMRGISMTEGDGTPATWLDLTQGVIDILGQIEYVRFGACSDDAVTVVSALNMHWDHLRWDGCGGYAIRSTSPHQLGEMVIERFTYDNAGGTGGKGFLLVDNDLDRSNIGVVVLRSGRVEINIPWVGDKAVVTYKVPDATTNVLSMGLKIEDFTFISGLEADGGVLYHRYTAQSTGYESLILDNVRTDGLTDLITGKWGSTRVKPPLRNHYDRLSINSAGSGSNTSAELQNALFWAANISEATAWRVRTVGDTADRINANWAGQLRFGSGSATPDVSLNRITANVLGMAPGDGFRFARTTTAGRPSAATLGKGVALYDDDLEIPIWSDGTNWCDAAGNTV